jgi:hypothetical protein
MGVILQVYEKYNIIVSRKNLIPIMQFIRFKENFDLIVIDFSKKSPPCILKRSISKFFFLEKLFHMKRGKSKMKTKWC